jgi:hypothetical protein
MALQQIQTTVVQFHLLLNQLVVVILGFAQFGEHSKELYGEKQ